MKQQFLRVAAAAMVCAAAATTASAQMVSNKPVRIGLIAPMSGASAHMGVSALAGAQLAVNEINEAGGFVGRRIELVLRDDKANPDEGVKVSEDLVLKEKVDFTIGFANSGVALKAMDTFQNNKHLLMVPIATATPITTRIPPKDSFIFRLSVPDSVQARVLADEATKTTSRIAVFADTTGYGEAGFNDVIKFLEAKHVKPVYVARFPIGIKSLVEQVRAARAAGAEAIISYILSNEAVALVNARVEVGYKGRLLAPWGVSHLMVVEQAGAEASEGLVMVQSYIQDWSNERRSSFAMRMKRLTGTAKMSTMMAAAQTYDSVHLMLRAMFQTRGDTSGLALKRALENLERPYSGVVTTYERPYSPTDHEAISRNMAWLGVWHNGEVQFFYPQEAKLSAMVRHKESNDDAPVVTAAAVTTVAKAKETALSAR